MLGDDTSLSSPAEIERRVLLPVQVYPMFEVALRAAAGRTPDEQRRCAARLWSRFSEVAATNPHAWIQQAFTPEEIATPSADQPDDRLPVHEAHELEQPGRAGRRPRHVLGRDRPIDGRGPRPLGLPAVGHRRPRPLVPLQPHRPALVAGDAHRRRAGARRWPASRPTSSTTSTSTRASPPPCRSARPSSGLDLERPLTVTGGMSFAGGPWNNYPMHAIATMADRLRDEPGTTGLVSGNGGYTTKHAFGVYATTPPAARLPPRGPAGRGRRHAATRGGRRLRRARAGRDLHRHARPRRRARDRPVRAAHPGGRPHLGLRPPTPTRWSSSRRSSAWAAVADAGRRRHGRLGD